MSVIQLFRNLIGLNRDSKSKPPIGSSNLSRYDYDVSRKRFEVDSKVLNEHGFNHFTIDNKILVYMNNSKVLVGSEYGKAVYNELKLNEIIDKYGSVEIHLSDDILAVNPSFISPIIEAISLGNSKSFNNWEQLLDVIKFSSYTMNSERLEKLVIEGYHRIKHYIE